MKAGCRRETVSCEANHRGEEEEEKRENLSKIAEEKMLMCLRACNPLEKVSLLVSASEKDNVSMKRKTSTRKLWRRSLASARRRKLASKSYG